MAEKIIYTRWLAVELRRQGFPILRTEVNPNRPQFDCWVFEETAELISALLALTKRN